MIDCIIKIAIFVVDFREKKFKCDKSYKYVKVKSSCSSEFKFQVNTSHLLSISSETALNYKCESAWFGQIFINYYYPYNFRFNAPHSFSYRSNLERRNSPTFMKYTELNSAFHNSSFRMIHWGESVKNSTHISHFYAPKKIHSENLLEKIIFSCYSSYC